MIEGCEAVKFCRRTSASTIWDEFPKVDGYAHCQTKERERVGLSHCRLPRPSRLALMLSIGLDYRSVLCKCMQSSLICSLSSTTPFCIVRLSPKEKAAKALFSYIYFRAKEHHEPTRIPSTCRLILGGRFLLLPLLGEPLKSSYHVKILS